MYPLIGLATFLTLSSRALSECWFPDGTQATADTICNPNALVSACCYDKQACLSNGLCVSDPLDAQKARLHRGTCSDKTWKSGNCPRQCTSIANNGVPVYSCNQTNSDSYCCFDNCKCNDQKFETFSFPDLDVYTVTIIGEPFTQKPRSSSSSTSTPTSSATLAVSTTGIATAPPNPITSTGVPNTVPTATPTTYAVFSASKSNSSLSIGLGVGVGVGAALLLGASMFFFFRRRRMNKQEQQQHQSSRNINSNPYTNDTAADTHGIPQLAEMDNSGSSIQYFPPTQKYALFTSDASVDSNQRSISRERLFDTPPVELASTRRSDPIELPASPSFGSKNEKSRPY